MNSNLKKLALSCLLVLALLSTLAVGCAGDEGEKKVIIKAGYITDTSGMIASVMVPHFYAYNDVVNYLNENDPIPGAKFELATYDTHFDPARFIPGYEWVKERGAKIILSPMPQASEIIVPFLAKDKLPNFTPTATAVMAASEWTYSVGLPVPSQWKIPLKWIADNWPDYPTKPKIGMVGWNTDYELDVIGAVEDYCLAHPDEFEYVGDYLAPAGTVSWFGEVEKLKDCDWIGPCHGAGTGQATFIKEFRDKGYPAKFFSGEAMPCWVNLIVDKSGWPALSGTVSCQGWPWWSDTYAIVDLCKQILKQNHAGEADDIMYSGIGYIAAFLQMNLIYRIVKATAETVGAENVTGQAIRDMADTFSYTFEGFPELTFSGGDRVCVHHGAIYDWNPDAEELLRITDWISETVVE